MTPTIMPFMSEHLLQIPDLRMSKGYYFNEAEMRASGKLFERSGPAISAVLNDHVLASAGIQILWPRCGCAWTFLSWMIVRCFPIWLHRNMFRLLNETILQYGLVRVHAFVDPQFDAAVRWIERLGFEREGILKRFGILGEDLAIYARILKGGHDEVSRLPPLSDSTRLSAMAKGIYTSSAVLSAPLEV